MNLVALNFENYLVHLWQTKGNSKCKHFGSCILVIVWFTIISHDNASVWFLYDVVTQVFSLCVPLLSACTLWNLSWYVSFTMRIYWTLVVLIHVFLIGDNKAYTLPCSVRWGWFFSWWTPGASTFPVLCVSRFWTSIVKSILTLIMSWAENTIDPSE